MANRPSRRGFLQSSAVFGVWVATRGAYAAPRSASDKLNVAVIGVRGQGGANLKGCLHENIVALCDVDEKNLASAAEEAPGAKQYHDWRKLMDQKDIDAVVISVPDRNHVQPTLAALQLGRHVYCEKPLTYTVDECRAVQKATARAKVATQMGTQIHAMDNYRRVVELIQGGAIGEVKRVHVFVNGAWHGGPHPTDNPPTPSHLHWDLWIGGGSEHKYHPRYHPFHWRGWWDFGGGMLGDMACHHMDLPHWALGLTYPTSIEAEGPPVHPDAPPQWLMVNYQYPARKSAPPVHLTWYHGGKRPAELADGKLKQWGAGTLFVGQNGMLLADYSRHVLLPEKQYKDFQRPSQTIPASIGHHREWLAAARDGSSTTCNFDYSGKLTETVLLGNVAYKAGQRIEWDGASGRITNAPGAEKHLRCEYRKGWEPVKV